MVHLNHRLRGAESDGDEAFVRDLARSVGLPFHTEAADLALLDAIWSRRAGKRGRHSSGSWWTAA